MSDKTTPQSDEPAHEVIDQPMGDILSQKYLSYALSTIMSRSLPDVRDGLKPVHRRLLHAMNQLRLNPDVLPKKSARVVGDVIGKYHPHGDSAVYDTLVRLAQDFAVRYPLIDGQGNFGNIDGDNPAAMRYTEARMTETAIRLLEGIDENAVDFEQTYDGEGEEPVVLPANFPNLLANGAAGIAVGMATNIPPHNVAELCDAMLMMLDRDVETGDLMQVIQGPDLPTGGIIVEERENIRQAYEQGRGGFRVRARWEREDLKQGQYQLVVTEIPYQVQKAKLVEKIADLVTQRKLPMLDDIRDESAEDIRLVLVPKSRNVEPELLMEALFRHSDLESKISLNMNVLDQGRVPKVMSLKQVLQAFLAHRQDVLVRRSRHRLDNVRHRLEILEGYLAVYLNIDEVIRIIRDNDEPKPLLCEAFELSEVQADAVLNMRLRSLRKLEEQKIRDEHKKLEQERDELESLLASETKQWQAIRDQIAAMRKSYAPDTGIGARRTQLGQAPAPVDVDQLQEVMTEKEPITVVISQKGWIRAMKGHGHKLEEMKFKEGDKGRFALEGYTTDKIMFIATNGRVYTMAAEKLPSGRGFGEPLRLHVDMPNEADVIDMRSYREEAKYLLVADDGRGFIVKSDDMIAQTKNGKQVMTPGQGSKCAICRSVDDSHDHLAIIGANRKMLVFAMDDVPEMARGKGVILQKYKGARVSDAKPFNAQAGLSFKYGSGESVVDDLTPWLAKRGSVGRMPPNGFPKSNRFNGC